MQDVTARMAKKTAQGRDNNRNDSNRNDNNRNDSDCVVSSETTALDRRYGEIGISAVAAAVRYQGNGKNPAYAPTSNQWRDRIAEAAA
jgi:hypothetical protein